MAEARSTDALNARELTRRLVAREAAQNEAPDGVALAARAASERACRALSRSLGINGFNALLTRALAQTRTDHALLMEIRVGRNSEPILGGVPEIVHAYGAPAVAAGLEAVLETMLALLGRLIGEDMVAQLVEHSARIEPRNDEDMK